MMPRDNEALRQKLEALKEDVPPMPEGLHQRWMKAVEEAPMQEKKTRSIPWKRGLAVAAAAVFVLGGTLLTRDLNLDTPAPAGAPAQNQKAESASYDGIAYDSGTVTGGGIASYSARNATLMAEPAAAEETGMTDDSQEQKIIRTVSLTLGARDYASSLAAVKAACEEAGGWISSLTENGSDLRTARMTLRIPAEQLDEFLTCTEGWGRVISRSESTEDVTESYYDTQGRLATQQALMARLKELVEQAQDLSDILSLEAQMADTQYEIDRLTGALQQTDRQVDYATVSVTLREETASDEAANASLTLWQRLGGALRTGWTAFTDFLADAAVFLVCALPFLAVVAAAWLIVRLIRRRRR